MAEVSQPEHARAIGEDAYGVANARELPRALGVALDGFGHPRHAWRVDVAEVADLSHLDPARGVQLAAAVALEDAVDGLQKVHAVQMPDSLDHAPRVLFVRSLDRNVANRVAFTDPHRGDLSEQATLLCEHGGQPGELARPVTKTNAKDRIHAVTAHAVSRSFRSLRC